MRRTQGPGRVRVSQFERQDDRTGRGGGEESGIEGVRTLCAQLNATEAGVDAAETPVNPGVGHECAGLAPGAEGGEEGHLLKTVGEVVDDAGHGRGRELRVGLKLEEGFGRGRVGDGGGIMPQTGRA